MERIAENIKRFREFKNLTQEYLARELNISQSQYQRIESGEAKVKEETVKKLAEIFDVSPELLYNFDERAIFQQGNTNAVYKQVNNGEINFYQIDSKIEKLYEGKIVLLEEKIKALQEENDKLKGQ